MEVRLLYRLLLNGNSLISIGVVFQQVIQMYGTIQVDTCENLRTFWYFAGTNLFKVWLAWALDVNTFSLFICYLQIECMPAFRITCNKLRTFLCDTGYGSFTSYGSYDSVEYMCRSSPLLDGCAQLLPGDAFASSLCAKRQHGNGMEGV